MKAGKVTAWREQDVQRQWSEGRFILHAHSYPTGLLILPSSVSGVFYSVTCFQNVLFLSFIPTSSKPAPVLHPPWGFFFLLLFPSLNSHQLFLCEFCLHSWTLKVFSEGIIFLIPSTGFSTSLVMLSVVNVLDGWIEECMDESREPLA